MIDWDFEENLDKVEYEWLVQLQKAVNAAVNRRVIKIEEDKK